MLNQAAKSRDKVSLCKISNHTKYAISINDKTSIPDYLVQCYLMTYFLLETILKQQNNPVKLSLFINVLNFRNW